MSRGYGGIGLGLALVKKLAGLLYGDVGVASDPRRGSTFSVAIPVSHHA
jgi:signal transduction histidine kinase